MTIDKIALLFMIMIIRQYQTDTFVYWSSILWSELTFSLFKRPIANTYFLTYPGVHQKKLDQKIEYKGFFFGNLLR